MEPDAPANTSKPSVTETASPRLLQIVALIAALIALSLFIAGLVWPVHFEQPMARFILCAAFAVYLSVFFYVFWPQKIELRTIPGLGVPVSVAGPVAFWILVLLFLLNFTPTGDVGRFFYLTSDGEPKVPLKYPGTTTVEPIAKQFKYVVVPNIDKFEVEGIYVEFKSGDDTYTAWFRHAPYQRIKVTFSPYGEPQVDVSSTKE